MLGTGFARTLRAAQAGKEDAFVRLWRDANPAMIRYLRVVGHDDPYDEACEGWMTVVRGLPGFAGDETDWRVWVLACARQRAEDSTLRRAWGASAGTAVPPVNGDGDLELDEVLEPTEVVDPRHRAISETLSALRRLPLGQGEVVVLRLGAELPPPAVAHVVGVEEETVQRAEARALERLGTGADLVSWSLTAPPSRAELADEKVAVGAFRKVVSRARAEKVKVIAVGPGSPRTAARQASAGAAGGAPPRPLSRRGARSRRVRGGMDARSRAAARGALAGAAAGRSRTAVLGLVALSLSVVSLGGFGAAAYAGVLPTPVQQVMHDHIGAPAPRDAKPSPLPRRQPVTPPTTGRANPSSLVPKSSPGAAPTASVVGAVPAGSPAAPGKGNGQGNGNGQSQGQGRDTGQGKSNGKNDGKNDGKGNGNGTGSTLGASSEPTHGKPDKTPKPTKTPKAQPPAKAQPTAGHP